MIYKPEHRESYVHPDLYVNFLNVLSRIRVAVHREVVAPRIRGLEQHDRVVALIAEFGTQDTADMRHLWAKWRKPNELTVDTILKHLVRDGRLTRYMGGYSGMCASWHYRLP